MTILSFTFAYTLSVGVRAMPLAANATIREASGEAS
jgi:hypothetical protein